MDVEDRFAYTHNTSLAMAGREREEGVGRASGSCRTVIRSQKIHQVHVCSSADAIPGLDSARRQARYSRPASRRTGSHARVSWPVRSA